MLLFDAHYCMRYNQATCLPKSDPFWMITNGGVDAIVLRLGLEAHLMALQQPADIGPDRTG